MTATTVDILHVRDPVLFHCPLTGLPVCGDIEQSFEGDVSPFLLFAITDTGDLVARTEELPDHYRTTLQCVIESFDPTLTTEDMPTFVPTVLSPMLPDSAILFQVCSKTDENDLPEAFWVCMDFTLTDKIASVDFFASVARPE